MKRYEKIKNMTIDEMIDLISSIEEVRCLCCVYNQQCELMCEIGCQQWLEQEVENE